MGSSLFLNEKPREALSYYIKAEKIAPADPYIKHELALVYQKIKEYDLAFDHFKKAIKLKPDFSEAYNNMGILYFQQEKLKEALECFNKAANNLLYLTPHFAYHNIGLVYFKKEEIEKSIEYFKKSIDLAPDYAVAYYDLGLAYETLNRHDDAEATYKKLIEIFPANLKSHYSLAKLYQKNGQENEAIKKLKYIIDTDPRSPYAKEAMKLLDDIQ